MARTARTARAAGTGAEAVRKPPALLRVDREREDEQARRRIGALPASLRASYTWIAWIITSALQRTSYIDTDTDTEYGFNSRSRPPVCYRPSRPSRRPRRSGRSGRSGPALFALVLVIPRKASSYTTLRLAPAFTGIN